MMAGAMMEPQRILERGSAVHGWRWALLAALAVALLSGLSIGWEQVRRTTLFPLRTVYLDGDLAHVDEAELHRAVSSRIDGGLLAIDLGAVRRAVEALPWVAGAAVRRVWPDGLQVTVAEQRPVARWGEAALVTAAGKVFRPKRLPQGLPRLSGPPGSEAEVLTMFRAFGAMLRPAGLRLAALALDQRRSWSAGLAGGMRLVLGRQDTTDRLQRFLRAWPWIREGRPEGRPMAVDLRYPNGFAVRWDDKTHSEKK